MRFTGQTLHICYSFTYVMQGFNDFSEIQILKLRVVSSASGSAQSEVTKYISCIFEAEFFINCAIKSAILFSHAVVASVISRHNEIKIVGKLRTSFE